MVQFKSIKLVGFKSFADKTEIPLTDGVTCIVGPNGCGKSNVADAIRWVLGEQSAKMMRGSQMMDVIFNGTEKRKKMSFCEVTLTFDNTNRVPLFYEQYPGSVNDVSQLSYLIDKIHAYGYRSIGIILDRGYFSRQNIEYIDEKGFRFLMMVKGCKSLVSSMIRDSRGTFETVRSNHIAEGNLYGMTIKQPLYKGDQKQRYFHLFFNPMRMALEREELERKVEQMALELKKSEGAEDCKIGEPFSKYFTLHYQELRNGKKRFLFAEEKADAIAEQLRLCGYFCLISSEKMTAADAYRLYRGRDISEKLFRADKSFLGSKSLRVCSNESVSTKIFIEFVALIVRNRFYNLLKDEMLRLKVRRNWMTVPAAIRELEKIEMTRRNGTRYLMDYALTRNQKLILQCFGLSPEDVAERTQEISKTLANVEEQLSEQPERDYHRYQERGKQEREPRVLHGARQRQIPRTEAYRRLLSADLRYHLLPYPKGNAGNCRQTDTGRL